VRATIERAGAAKSEAESAYEAARAEAKLAKVLLERESKLLAQAVISQQQFDEVEARYQATAAREQATLARIRETSSSISEAQAALGEAQVSLDYAKIVAPFAGRILERHVDPGALAAPGAPLLVIAEEERLRVEAAVEATRADQVRIGDAVDVEIDTLSRPVQGKVGEIAPSVDVSSRAFLVKIDLPETVEPVHPGTFARVSFHVGSRPRLVVPSSAVSSLGALDRVFVVDGDRARLRMVTVGERQGNLTEVLSGLESSERVVTEPPLALRDGRTVEVAP
jgi:RND family efflux transporter MFP subunit